MSFPIDDPYYSNVDLYGEDVTRLFTKNASVPFRIRRADRKDRIYVVEEMEEVPVVVRYRLALN